MTNNDVLRQLRFILDLNDSKMISIFGMGGMVIDREQVSKWLKKDLDPDFQKCQDRQLAAFLTGLISHKRGQKEGEQPKPEKKLTNNIILRKLKIAFDMKSDDLLEVIGLGGLQLSEHELSAFFRKPEHKHYRLCKDQVLRNFLQGLQDKLRPESRGKTTFVWSKKIKD